MVMGLLCSNLHCRCCCQPLQPVNFFSDMTFFLAFLCVELPLSKTKSPTADIESKVSPKEKKLFDIKPEVEWSHKELKTETNVEDVKPSCFEKSDLTEELSVKSKLLCGRISQLEKEVAEKDKQIDEKNDLIAEKVEQAAKQDELIAKQAAEITKKNEQILQQAEEVIEKDKQIDEKNDQIVEKDKQIAERDEQIVKHQLMYEEILQGK